MQAGSCFDSTFLTTFVKNKKESNNAFLHSTVPSLHEGKSLHAAQTT